ncbi:hypothetical protein KIN20_017645 [Parelaphostrongylus tenuis]|uniref:Uncharacterized protein n=1 Tax=Parelaphostrongylus tenuis TaxID=148309 RepID=A0AAD5QRM0_PARTN|nr:hypothetical protein KIN20_017645 [Parelaphostrongylus tenuis]
MPWQSFSQERIIKALTFLLYIFKMFSHTATALLDHYLQSYVVERLQPTTLTST